MKASAQDTQSTETIKRHVKAAHEVYIIVEEAIQHAMTHGKPVRMVVDMPYDVAAQLPTGTSPGITMIVDVIVKFDGEINDTAKPQSN